MLLVVLTLYLLVALLILMGLGILQHVANDPRRVEGLMEMLGGSVDGRLALDGFSGLFVMGYNFLMLSQFLGIAAVISGHSVLHDRQCGTLTFLLLAPVRRIELLTGKVLGAMGPAFALYVVISGSTWALISMLSVVDGSAEYTPANPAWWIAFLLGGPLWSIFMSTVCTIVSSLAHDVRTAQQGVWFVVFFGTLICGFLLTSTLPEGVGMLLMVSLIGALGAVAAMVVGSVVIQRDLGR